MVQAAVGLVEGAGGVVKGAHVNVLMLPAVRTCQCMAEAVLPRRMAADRLR